MLGVTLQLPLRHKASNSTQCLAEEGRYFITIVEGLYWSHGRIGMLLYQLKYYLLIDVLLIPRFGSMIVTYS